MRRGGLENAVSGGEKCGGITKAEVELMEITRAADEGI